ncbi:MAG: hypothetical protein ACTS73_02180 [Arsenophonus sp. NEOnobi-MAG3]
MDLFIENRLAAGRQSIKDGGIKIIEKCASRISDPISPSIGRLGLNPEKL